MAGVFSFGPDDELIGFSIWPWDELYRPVVAVFVGGRMIAHAFCELERPRFMPKVSVTLLARVGRKLTGARITPQPIALEGPQLPTWFALSLPAEIVARLRACDPNVRLARLEDGDPVIWEGAAVECFDKGFVTGGSLRGEAASQEAPTFPGIARSSDAPMTVEALLELKSAEPTRAPLDGFAAFCDVPFSHQLDITFVELLRRLPDPAAREGYLPALEDGVITLFDLRRMIMQSDEFRLRRVGLQDRIGTLYTSTLWRELARWPTIEQATRPRKRFSLQAHAALSEEAFIHAACDALLDRKPDEARLGHYREVARMSGRRAVALELLRWAELRGEGVELV